jgi:hypothetical protein
MKQSNQNLVLYHDTKQTKMLSFLLWIVNGDREERSWAKAETENSNHKNSGSSEEFDQENRNLLHCNCPLSNIEN